jgi:hypothetical protein
MQRYVLTALLITTSTIVSGAIQSTPIPVRHTITAEPTNKECGKKDQDSLIESLHLGKDSKNNPDSCALILDLLLARVVPKDKTLEKTMVKAIERKTQALTVTFLSADARVVDVYTLRAHKKDTGGVDFRYGAILAADKAWSEWKTNYVDVIDCDESATRAVTDTHLRVPAVGIMVCSGAFGRAVAQYNPLVVQKHPGVIEWAGYAINASAIAAVRIQKTNWSVYEGTREIYTTNVFRVKANSLLDANRQPWEATFGKKIDADAAQREIVDAMGIAINNLKEDVPMNKR